MSTESTSADPAPSAPPPTGENAAAAASSGSVPKADKAKAGIGKTPRKWNPPPAKKISRGLAITLIVISTVMMLGFLWVMVQVALPAPEAEMPKLDREFTDPINSYSIRPPISWHIEDPHDKSNIYIKGPREPGFSPLIITSLDIAPGSLSSYLQLHKGRIESQDKTVKWISEDLGESIDGCPQTARLEYECTQEMEGAGPVKVRALQYVMEDKPRFYRVTCFVASNLYEKYLPKFEASVRSFRRMPLPRALPGAH
jgi:hypothetical protein